jgi:hypothetical protein
MTLLRRRPRAVYRVYGEDEYLAGADPFVDWDAPPEPDRDAAPTAEPTARPQEPNTRPRGCSRERRLRRLAGAAALTGAVGAVGATIAVVGLRSEPAARQIAANLSTAVRAAPSVIVRSDASVSPVRGVLPRAAIGRDGVVVGKGARQGGKGTRRGFARHRPAPVTGHRGSHSDLDTGMHMVGASRAAALRLHALTRRAPSPSAVAVVPQPAVQSTPEPAVANTASSVPSEVPARPQAQGEFGFERRDG